MRSRPLMLRCAGSCIARRAAAPSPPLRLLCRRDPKKGPAQELLRGQAGLSGWPRLPLKRLPQRHLGGHGLGASGRRGAAQLSGTRRVGDPYLVLGLDRRATFEDVKTAYKRLALEWHPDRNRGNASEAEVEFKLVSQAYTTLSDPELRQIYDHTGVVYTHEMGAEGESAEQMSNEDVAAVFEELFEDKPPRSVVEAMERASEMFQLEMSGGEEELLRVVSERKREALMYHQAAHIASEKRRRAQLALMAEERASKAFLLERAISHAYPSDDSKPSFKTFAFSRLCRLEFRAQGLHNIRRCFAIGVALSTYIFAGFSLMKSLLVCWGSNLLVRGVMMGFLRLLAPRK